MDDYRIVLGCPGEPAYAIQFCGMTIATAHTLSDAQSILTRPELRMSDVSYLYLDNR
jgi:hypothetical protein